MATISTLAVEVLQRIVDELDPYIPSWTPHGPDEDVKACNLVSKSFRHCALKSLYHTVRIDASTPARNTALKDLILPPSNSQLGGVGPYIRWAFISIPSEASDTAADTDKIKEFLGSDSLIAIMKALQDEETSGLRKLVFDMGNRPIKYKDIPQDCQIAFHSLIRFAYLTHLEVFAVDLLPPTLLKGTHLDNFATGDCTLDEDGISTLDSQHSDPLLTTLCMDFSCPLPVDLRHLQKLSLPHYFTKPQHASKYWQLIIDVSESLEHLGIWPLPYESYSDTAYKSSSELSPPESFSLDRIPNLKTLAYSHYHGPGPTPNSLENNFSTLLQLFDVKSPMTKLEHVELFIHLGSISAMDELSSKMAEDRSLALDEILTSEKFPCLNRVGFIFALCTPLRHLEIQRSYFTKLASSDKINFNMRLDLHDAEVLVVTTHLQ